MRKSIKFKTVSNQSSKIEIVSLYEAYNSFIRSRRIKNLSENTITTYTFVIEEFIRCIGGMEQPITAVSLSSVEDYILYLKSNGKNKDVTINSKTKSLRPFISYCVETFGVDAFKMPIYKCDDVEKEPYTTEECKKLLAMPHDDSTFVEWRNWCMVCFFLATGCRLSTAAAVKVKDLDFDNYKIKFNKLKNRHVQTVPMSPMLKKNIELYLGLWDATEDDYLFPDAYGRNIMQKSTVISTMKKYNKSRNVTTTGIHRFRHTFAKNYIMNGGDALRLQKILGHSTLDMTNHYVKLYGMDLNVNYSDFCALDKLS